MYTLGVWSENTLGVWSENVSGRKMYTLGVWSENSCCPTIYTVPQHSTAPNLDSFLVKAAVVVIFGIFGKGEGPFPETQPFWI